VTRAADFRDLSMELLEASLLLDFEKKVGLSDVNVPAGN